MKSGAGGVSCRLPREEMSPGLSDVYILASGGAEEMAPSAILQVFIRFRGHAVGTDHRVLGKNRKHKQTVASSMLGPSGRLLNLIN